MIFCYNYYLHKDTILNEGDEFCPRCKGSGIQSDPSPRYCKKCLGKGKLDWIEQAMGVNPSTIDLSIRQKFLNEASKYLADQIDKEILDAIYNIK